MIFAELKLKTTGRDIEFPSQLQREYENKTLTEEEWNEIKGKYAIIQYGGKQAGEGYIGIEYWYNIWLNNNCNFFNTKEEAKVFCKKAYLGSYKKKGGLTIASNIIGARQQTVKIVKISEANLNKYFRYDSWVISPSWKMYEERKYIY